MYDGNLIQIISDQFVVTKGIYYLAFSQLKTGRKVCGILKELGYLFRKMRICIRLSALGVVATALYVKERCKINGNRTFLTFLMFSMIHFARISASRSMKQLKTQKYVVISDQINILMILVVVRHQFSLLFKTYTFL